MARLKELYVNEVAPALMKSSRIKASCKSRSLTRSSSMSAAAKRATTRRCLTPSLPTFPRSRARSPFCARRKKSVANFKLREGMVIGVKVTLRGERMYEFLDRFFNLALPRVRDFRGINPNSFDGRGNYSMGIREQLIFPEIDYDKIDKVRGMDICFVTTANTDEEARELLALMGAPFSK